MMRAQMLWTIAGLWALLAGPAQATELKPAHTFLKSSRAQANREQIFKHLMTGSTPTWLQGKSPAQVRAWSQRVQKAINRNAEKVVRSIVANPDASPTKREQMILGLVAPQQRAKLLKEVAGFKVDKVRYKVNGVPTDKYKITLKRHGFNPSEWGSYGTPTAEFAKQMKIYDRVMGANIITYAPAGGHSKYVSQGEMIDLYGGSPYGAVRPNKHPLFPTWLSDVEAARMKEVFDVGNNHWSYALGTKMSHGRPGMWPPTKTQRAATGNSCTTTFIRAPIGDRDPQYAWIDALQEKVAAAAKAGQVTVQGVDLSGKRLLEAITGKKPADYQAVFAALKQQLPREARNLDKLKGEVDFFHDKLKGRGYGYYSYGSYNSSAEEKCMFPMDLMHRTPLSQMAGITGDPVGPGMAKQKFRAGDPTRLGVVTVFEKGPANSSRW
jgi:hypothetical protein